MGTPFLSPDASPLRRAVERRSALVLVFLRGLPRAMPALVVLGVAALGLAGEGLASAAALAAVALFLGWLAYLAWPRLPAVGRLVRVVSIVLVTGAAVARVVS